MGMSRRSIKLSKGFTLIELVMVIVILGILAAVALPKFVDLSGKAGAASAAGVAGAISAGSAANFAARKAGILAPTTIDVKILASCAAQMVASTSVVQGGTPTGFTVTTAAGTCVPTSDSMTCTVTNDSTGQTATALLYCNP